MMQQHKTLFMFQWDEMMNWKGRLRKLECSEQNHDNPSKVSGSWGDFWTQVYVITATVMCGTLHEVWNQFR